MYTYIYIYNINNNVYFCKYMYLLGLNKGFSLERIDSYNELHSPSDKKS